MSVADAQARISSVEFIEWIAFYQIEPFGPLRNDMVGAQICAVLANINRGKGGKKLSTKDFLFDFQPPAKKNINHMKMIIDAAAATAGF
jgi:hypothetical protein|tara:strand:- start:17980 stop:18246 length:267 start_codon:yes stop_codon:yes gene_type:complete